MLGELGLKKICVQVLVVRDQLSDCLMRLEEVQDTLLMLLQLVDAHFTEISCLPLWHSGHSPFSQSDLLLYLHDFLALSLLLEDFLLNLLGLRDLDVKVDLHLLFIGLVILLKVPLVVKDPLPFVSLSAKLGGHQIQLLICELGDLILRVHH
jgi:hypothetical protein